ncbi:hypothetical protein ZWY2020_045396 [Hordeum vulgare]|nr:hypothetical protein ZWY2020_045396 [Hordeum vulgare]
MRGAAVPLFLHTLLPVAQCTGTCFCVKISYYEVYMERCYDLLEPKAKEIMVLDDNLGNLQLKGLAWAPVHFLIHMEFEDTDDTEEEIIAGPPLRPQCNTELHADYGGAAVKWGLTHHKESAADCCQACLDQLEKQSDYFSDTNEEFKCR